MSSVFQTSTANGAFTSASTAMPQTSSQERRQEAEYVGDADATSHQDKRPAEDDSPTNLRVKKSKKPELQGLVDAWTQSLAVRMEVEKSRMDRHKATSSQSSMPTTKEDATYEEAIDALNAVPGVDDISYNKALKRFVEYHWRRMFLAIPEERRKGWVDNID